MSISHVVYRCLLTSLCAVAVSLGANIPLLSPFMCIMITGWTDTLVLYYKGPDSGNSLRVIPGHAFLPHCTENKGKCGNDEWTTASSFRSDCFVDRTADNTCKLRQKCPKGTYNAAELTPVADRNCLKCDSTNCENGVAKVTTTIPFDGQSVTKPTATKPSSHTDYTTPTCGNNCAFRLRAW